MTPADFRLAQQRTPQLDAGTRAVLASQGVDATAIDPPSAEFEEKPGGGHKIGQLARGAVVRPFGWQGAERVDDGRFVYEFDVKGRLIRATEKASVPPIRRLVYSYSGAGRVVGRRAEYTTVASPSAADWKLEDRPQILAADGLPADTTFAWDLLSDRLLAVYRAGATPSTDAHGGLLKQVIHGGLAYDDPIETTTIDANSGAVTHLYPVYEEAGAGALQIVINTRGEVVARNLSNDPYGGEDVVFTGAAIDGATVKAIKTQNGALSSVEVTLRATEQLAVATVASGARLAAVDATGALVRTSQAAASRAEDDPYTIRWTLSAADWSALTDPAPVQISGTTRTPAALSIAATNALRAEAWSAEVPIMPAPEWATATKSVYTSPALPVEIRESFTSLTTFLDSIAANEEKTATLYEVENLPLLGTPGSDTLIEQTLSATFQALPFSEPATGLVYARARWYDPGTGSFLTPDPAGYRDSSNLYAFAGGDPVNQRDPAGEAAHVSQSGWIIATDNRNGGRIVRFSPEQVKKDPLGVRRFLGLNADVDPREADAMLARAGQMAALGNAAGIAAVMRGTQMAEPVVDATGTVLTVLSAFTGIGGAAQLTQAFVDDGATKTNLALAGLTVVGLGGVDDIARLAGTTADAASVIRRTAAPLSKAEKDLLRTQARDIWQQYTGRRAIWDDLEVHHRIPLEWSHVFRGDPNRAANLVGVSDDVHRQITASWNTWRRSLGGRTPTSAEIMQQALKIDQEFARYMRFVR
jgi:RHS repeat-associated protein